MFLVAALGWAGVSAIPGPEYASCAAQDTSVFDNPDCLASLYNGNLILPFKWDGMTTAIVSTCEAFCKGNNYPIMGLYNGGECYCGTKLPPYAG